MAKNNNWTVPNEEMNWDFIETDNVIIEGVDCDRLYLQCRILNTTRDSNTIGSNISLIFCNKVFIGNTNLTDIPGFNLDHLIGKHLTVTYYYKKANNYLKRKSVGSYKATLDERIELIQEQAEKE